MKTVLRKLCLSIFFFGALMTGQLWAQIDYMENFSTGNSRWLTHDFPTTDIAVCDNEAAFRANPVNELGTVMPVEAVSKSLGVSNGEEVRLTYTYKLLYYDSVLPYQPVDDPDWGLFVLEYGPTINGPWTTLDAITPDDHVVSAECARRSVAFTPVEGTEVYLRLLAGGGSNPDISYYVYVDDISALQDTLTPNRAEPAQKIIAYPNPVTDYLMLDYYGTLPMWPSSTCRDSTWQWMTTLNAICSGWI